MVSDSKVKSATESDLSGFLTYRVARLNAALNQQATALLDQTCGLTQGQWRIIITLGRGGAETSKALNELTRLDPALISRLLRQLEEIGLVETGRNTTDRRLLDVRLTARGKDVLNKTWPIMARRQDALRDAITPAEFETLQTVLSRLYDHVVETLD